ncbi:transporter substrate-binding domain-containing protein [Pradoshia sp. D12]|uniref:transporter substrate-binding domain-containing protein n=1 Tax=Bacillaceae TaxID=186817 RepID=UPI00080AC6BF|nr:MULTISPECIES: transporter substrate-binding domain-containing protein [Bacillaceae]OCA86228.1 amino acid ABC transporter substrate-binding protein [Bacillus sp. FJAT-27986]QFK72022.1 transporter substrate-binding domain-containing protein [Pradoshia sp. D12]TPF71486.1 transporter substrate-binding domain-containing protein [Bacillus sp. D12]
MITTNSFKRLVSILAIAMLALVTAACSNNKGEESKKEEKTGWEAIKESGKLKVATSGTLYPASYHDSETNELTGYDVEVTREVAKRLNLEAEFTEMAFDGMLASINNGQTDIAVNDITATEERREKFSFSEPYKYSFGAAIVRKSDLSGIKDLDSLKGKKAAGEATTTYMEVAREHGAEEVIYDNATNDQYLRDVSTGRTDIILNDYYTQRLAVAAFPEFDITVHPNIKYNPSNQAILMKKDNSDLLNEINKVLEEMKTDGTMAELSKKFYDSADVTKEVQLDSVK